MYKLGYLLKIANRKLLTNKGYSACDSIWYFERRLIGTSSYPWKWKEGYVVKCTDYVAQYPENRSGYTLEIIINFASRFIIII